MTHHVGFLYLSDSFGFPKELINEARVMAALESDQGTIPHLSDISADPCPGLSYDPCTVSSSGVVTSWQLMDFDPAAAPWYGTSPASQEALGFTIEEWTGLDGGHHTRQMTPIGNRPGGARFGPSGEGHRVMALTVVLHGLSERGLSHLFRWLETTLIDSCVPCGTPTSMWAREFCPAGTTEGDLEEGLVRADDVVLLAGPTWVEPPILEASAYFRRATFTLAAGDPCLYAVRRSLATTAATFPSPAPTSSVLRAAGCGEWGGTATQVSVEVEAADHGLTSPLIKITTPLQMYAGSFRCELPPMRIYGVVDRAGVGFRPCELPRTGAIFLSGVPGGYEVVIDGADASIRARDLHGSREWHDGAQFLRMAADIDESFVGPRSLSFNACASGWVIVEPAQVATDGFLGGGENMLSTWTVEIQAIARVGCI